MYCRNCRNELIDTAVICIVCGEPPQRGCAFCQQCGEETNPRAKFCTGCGVRLATYIPENAKSKIVAGLLGIFGGGIGIHRFYLGFMMRGVIQIIVTLLTCGVGALWGVIEGIMILAGKITKDAEGNSLTD